MAEFFNDEMFISTMNPLMIKTMTNSSTSNKTFIKNADNITLYAITVIIPQHTGNCISRKQAPSYWYH